jgi:hypothetical protein
MEKMGSFRAFNKKKGPYRNPADRARAYAEPQATYAKTWLPPEVYGKIANGMRKKGRT